MAKNRNKSNKDYNPKSKGSRNQKSNRNGNGKYSKDIDRSKDPRDEKDVPRKDRSPRKDSYESRGNRAIPVSTGGDVKNDVSWYMRASQLVNDATKVSFFNQLGRKLPITTGSGGWDQDLDVPGICVINTHISPGYADTPQDAANVAAIGTFEYLRKAITTVVNYDAPDVFNYVFAIDNIYAMYSNILRAFGLAAAWQVDNLYTPLRLIHALYGFNEEMMADFITNIASYRARFNQLVFRCSALYLPTDFTITERHAWLFANIFGDHESTKAQIYAHRMASCFVLSEEKYDTGSACVWYDIDKLDGRGMKWYLDQFELMIERVRSSDMMRRIAADMMKAFEDRSSWTLAYCDETYTVRPAYSSEVLSQIENIRMIPIAWVENPNSLDVQQSVDTLTVEWKPYVNAQNMLIDADNETKAAACSLFYKPLINMHWNDPKVEDIVVATRQTSCVDRVAHNGHAWFKGVGSDFVSSCELYTNADSLSSAGEYAPMIMGPGVPFDEVGVIAAWATFDWAPQLWLWEPDPTLENPYGTLRPIEEWDNYTSVDMATMVGIHRAVIASMWMIPQLNVLGS